MSKPVEPPDLGAKIAEMERRLDRLERLTRASDTYYDGTDPRVIIGDVDGTISYYGIKVMAPNGTDAILRIDGFGVRSPYTHLVPFRANETDSVTVTSATEFYFADATVTGA